jgi:glycerol-3-phosphate dehydrogenase (NAD(P)+)
MKIAVLGAGAWGTAMAISLARRHAVALWTRDAGQRAAMGAARANEKYLPGYAFPSQLEICDDVALALKDAALGLIGVSTSGLRATLRETRAARADTPLVWLCKGFDPERAKLAHEVAAEESIEPARSGVLSGPSFAQEVAAGLPAAVTLASQNHDFARAAARMLHGPAFRVYSSADLVGVEVAGAVKNVIAIAAGICDGLRYGLNARAALMTRGLAEVARLGVALGGRAETFMGLAGAGDLILTCTGDLSRNRRVGLALARGEPLSDILAGLGHVAEGVNTARALARIAGRLQVDMPITQAVCRVLDDQREARAAAEDLLQREPKAER